MKYREITSLGLIATKLDKLLSSLSLVVPTVFADMASRGIGWLMEFGGMPFSDGAEDRIRGILTGPHFNAIGLRIGRAVTFHGRKNIRLGNNVSIGSGTFMSATGPCGHIEIGRNTHIDVGSILYGQGGLVIGSDCAIAAGFIVYTQTNQYDAKKRKKIIEQGTRYAAVTIGNDVWIGAGVRILPGVTIGDHAVVGAGAVVTGDVPPWKVVVGVPARVVNDRRGTKK